MSFICEASSRVKPTHAGRTVIPWYCNAWSCPVCLLLRLKRLTGELAAGLPNIFITITWRIREGWTPEEAARVQRAAWAKWAALYNRRHPGPPLPYMIVCEATELGQPHLHILVRAKWISQKELSAFMKAEIDSPIVDVKSLKQVRHVALYLAKYLTKGPHQFGTLKRYWKTQNWLPPEWRRAITTWLTYGRWERDPRSWQRMGFDAALRGFRVDHLDPGVFIHARAPP